MSLEDDLKKDAASFEDTPESTAKKGTRKDISKSAARLQRIAEGTGQKVRASGDVTQQTRSSFMPKAFRAAGKIYGQKELADFQNNMKLGVNKILDFHGVQDKNIRSKASAALHKKFNEFGKQMMESSLKFERSQKEQLRDADARIRGSQQFNMMMGSTIEGVMRATPWKKIIGESVGSKANGEMSGSFMSDMGMGNIEGQMKDVFSGDVDELFSPGLEQEIYDMKDVESDISGPSINDLLPEYESTQDVSDYISRGTSDFESSLKSRSPQSSKTFSRMKNQGSKY